MNPYLRKYVGKYRVKAEIDLRTNDFCRTETGDLENDQDVYIMCANGIKIFHYGGKTLQAYIPSLKRGKKIIRDIYCAQINKDNTTVVSTEDGSFKVRIEDPEVFKTDMAKQELIFDIKETDSEVLFKFSDKDMDKIAQYLRPSTTGAYISPFSPRNLKKKKSVLGNNQMEEYKKIIDRIPKEDKLKVKKINDEFCSTILQKVIATDYVSMKREMVKLQVKMMDYINIKGQWSEYIKFLDRRVTELYGN